MRIKAVIIVLLTVLLAGCVTSAYDIRQLETTYLNEETGREYVQKNAVMINRDSGETWVFSSDENSNYRWIRLPVSDKAEAN